MTAERVCLLCGNDDRRSVSMGLVAWKEPHDGRSFDAIPRCTDPVSCRERCDAIDEPWMVRDGKPRHNAKAVYDYIDDAGRFPAERSEG